MMIQSAHNFAHDTTGKAVVTCANLWPDWIIITRIKVIRILAGFHF